MKMIIKNLFFIGIGVFFVGNIFFFSESYVFASTTLGTIDSTHKYAWSENVGWINFSVTSGNVLITDSVLSGYAWAENIGWISLNCSNDSSCSTVDYKVSNTNQGVLSGYAWSENTGWINFRPSTGGVTINTDGKFLGYAWGENIGWIVFNCATTSSCSTVDYKVKTDWRPISVRTVPTRSSHPQPFPILNSTNQILTPRVIAGCADRTTGFSVTTGQSCATNISISNSSTILKPSNPSQSSGPSVYNFGTITLKSGYRGEPIKEVQRFLNNNLKLNLSVDGILGPKTTAVIKKWQKDHDLISDGIVGKKTKAMMNAERR